MAQRTVSIPQRAGVLSDPILFEALSRRAGGESVKAAVLRNGPYQGLQQRIVFDANGDTQRKVFFTEIRDGAYRKLDETLSR